MTSADILSAIDGAIDDWETSGDAMRWIPESAAKTAPTAELVWRVETARWSAWYERLIRAAAVAAIEDAEHFTQAFERLAEVCASTGTEVQRFWMDEWAAPSTEDEPDQRPRLPQPQRCDDRPAYVSPHGPPPRRRR